MPKTERTSRRQRYNEIGRVLVRNGFDWLITKWGLDEIFGTVRKWRGLPRAPVLTQPERVRRVLEELGSTFVKLGQVLSTRPDLLPPEYIAEMSKLQDQAQNVARHDIAATIAHELGGPPEEVFLAFTVKPCAAASIGQVHAAVLQDGTRVVVKIQRPGREARVEEDLAILRDLARFISEDSPIGKQYDMEGWVDEFAFTLRNELDYTREGRNADRIREDFARDSSLCVPAIYWQYTTKRVLTMEEITGIKISDLASAHNVMLVPHCSSVYSYHFVITRTNSPFAEYLMRTPDADRIEPMFAPILLGEPLPENGRIRLTDAPGFGVWRNPDCPLERPFPH